MFGHRQTVAPRSATTITTAAATRIKPAYERRGPPARAGNPARPRSTPAPAALRQRARVPPQTTAPASAARNHAAAARWPGLLVDAHRRSNCASPVELGRRRRHCRIASRADLGARPARRRAHSPGDDVTEILEAGIDSERRSCPRSGWRAAAPARRQRLVEHAPALARWHGGAGGSGGPGRRSAAAVSQRARLGACGGGAGRRCGGAAGAAPRPIGRARARVAAATQQPDALPRGRRHRAAGRAEPPARRGAAGAAAAASATYRRIAAPIQLPPCGSPPRARGARG